MLNPSTDPDFTGKTSAPTTEYPHGSARDAVIENDPAATPLLAKKFNDDWGFDAALLAAAGIAPSGTPDTALASQKLDAVRRIISALGGAQFATTADLVLGTTLGGAPADFGFMAGISAVVHTRWRDTTSKEDGAVYTIRTDAVYQADTGGAPDGVQDFYVGGGTAYVAQMSKTATARLRIGTDPLVGSAAKRDAAYIGRTIRGLTDCHAYTDRTVITDVTDAGTYGAFDAVTKVSGSHAQSHLFAFQDRTIYDGVGAGTIGSWGNITWPKMTGAGAVGTRYGQWVKDIDNTGTGTVGTQIGLFMEDLNEAASNSAVTLSQSTGFTMFAPNAGKWEIGGNTVINGTATLNATTIVNATCYLGKTTKAGGLANATAPIAGVALTVERDGIPTRGFVDPNSIGVSLGVEGDGKVQFTVAAVARVLVENAAAGYALRPAANTQSLGTAAFRWSEVFALNGVINTSDARHKQQARGLNAAERRVGVALRGLMRVYKFNEAVEAKGDRARFHAGVMAQDVKTAFEAEGLDPFAYGVLCHDTWDEQTSSHWVNKGETVTRQKAVTRQKTVTATEDVADTVTSVEDGVAVQRTVVTRKEVTRLAFDTLDVVGEDGVGLLDKHGDPVRHKEPIMETVVVDEVVDAEPRYETVVDMPAGERYGVRYDELYGFVIAAL
jgi:hypothetical protein